MPIGDPAQEYFKDGIWAYDASAQAWVKLSADANGYLKVAEQSPISGFATAANQSTIITALQLIDDLRNALDSVATDELLTIFHSQDVDVEVKQTASADLVPGIAGWNGSAWHKLPLLWGYSAQLLEDLGGTKSGDGTYNATSTAVPANELHVLTLASITNLTGARAEATIFVAIPTNFARLATTFTPAQYEPTVFSGHLFLAPGNKVSVTQGSCLDSDVIRAAIAGYKMKLTE